MPDKNAALSNAELEAMDELDLEQLAADRGLTVTGAAGAEPTHEDYVRALQSGTETGSLPKSPAPGTPMSPDGRVLDQNTPTNTGAAAPLKLDKTIKGGRYLDASGRFVNAHGQLIDEDGTVIDGTVTPSAPVPE